MPRIEVKGNPLSIENQGTADSTGGSAEVSAEWAVE